MISPQHPLASWFLLISVSFFLLVYGLPLLLVPLKWARWFGWKVQEGNTDLTVYFARCLGAVALSIIFTVVRYVPDPGSQPALFDLIGLACLGLMGVHIWGALRKAQPLSETVEIFFYGVVGAVAVYIRFELLG